jgi:hypothetical protein
MHDAELCPQLLETVWVYETQSDQPKHFNLYINTRSVLESNKKGKKKTL